MAARKQLWHPDEVRAKIQASQLLNRLHDHAFGNLDLTQTQLKAIEILLKKSMPDLSAVSAEHSGEVKQNVTVRIVDAGTDVSHPASTTATRSIED